MKRKAMMVLVTMMICGLASTAQANCVDYYNEWSECASDPQCRLEDFQAIFVDLWFGNCIPWL